MPRNNPTKIRAGAPKRTPERARSRVRALCFFVEANYGVLLSLGFKVSPPPTQLSWKRVLPRYLLICNCHLCFRQEFDPTLVSTEPDLWKVRSYRRELKG